MSNYLKYTALVFFGATGIAAIDPASAQQTSNVVEQGLEEIIVTARKRAEKLQDVPISITAFTADAIEQRGIESVYDIARLTPNLSFNQTYGRTFDRPVIRGMSQILGERTVSFVVDGVYIAGNITLISSWSRCTLLDLSSDSRSIVRFDCNVVTAIGSTQSIL